MKISDNYRVVIAVSILVSIVIAVVVAVSHKIDQDYNNKSLKGKGVEALTAKLSKMPFGTVIVTKAGEVYLLNKVESPTISFNSRRQPGISSVFDFAKDVADFYEPHNNLKERMYLLEKFAQGEKVPENWKKAVPEM